MPSFPNFISIKKETHFFHLKVATVSSKTNKNGHHMFLTLIAYNKYYPDKEGLLDWPSHCRPLTDDGSRQME